MSEWFNKWYEDNQSEFSIYNSNYESNDNILDNTEEEIPKS